MGTNKTRLLKSQYRLLLDISEYPWKSIECTKTIFFHYVIKKQFLLLSSPKYPDVSLIVS